ncbi:MAG: hypothetical protein V4565_09035 [Bacteroidota bacterium]
MNSFTTVKFQKWICFIEMGIYPNGRKAIELINARSGEPVLVATINVPEICINEDEVIIKNYSENEGILDALIGAEIISRPVRIIQTGLIESPICKLLN